jgi:type II secretory pathway predicted ATPase ExeA
MQATAERLENTWPNQAHAGQGPFFRSASYEEALARAHFLVEHRKLLGLFVGESGTGRSSLFVDFAHQLRRIGLQVACLHLYGVSADEMLWQLAASLGINPPADATTGKLWRSITDALAAARFQQQHVVMLLDDVDRAQPKVLTAIMRIAKCDPAAVGNQTLVLGCHSDRITAIGPALLDLATLRIELGSWSADETEQYLRASLQATEIECASDVGARLYELSAGVPRRAQQLLDLALVATQAQDSHLLENSLLDAVAGQLAVRYV